MNIEIIKISLPAKEVADNIACKINDEELFPDIEGDFSQRFEVSFSEKVQIGKDEKEIEVEMIGALAGRITSGSIGDEPEYSELLSRYIVYGDVRCFLDGNIVEFNEDEIYQLIEKKVNV